MKILRYIAFFLVADILITIPLFLFWGLSYINNWSWWVKIPILLIAFRFGFELIESLTYLVCKISPNYKIVFWSFVIIIVLQNIGFFVNPSVEIPKNSILFLIGVVAVGTIPILKTAYFYVFYAKVEQQEELDNELKEYNNLKNRLNDL